MGLGGQLANINGLFTTTQKLSIQAVSVSFATLSITACLLSLYWFLLMQRNFRRTLIMMLLFSDLFKSFWYMLFPAVSLSVGGIKSTDPFCDVGGFFLQMGLEACDFVILFMSIHMYMQIFHANNKYFGPDGLYRIRWGVYALWLLAPAVMSALAFLHVGGYLSQGAFCSLPIRPFWFRLALSWIPRYLIWAFAIITAILIYRHAGSGFKLFAKQAGDSASKETDATGTHNSRAMASQRQSQHFGGTDMTKSLVAVEKDVDMMQESMPSTLQIPDGATGGGSRRPSLIRFDLESGNNTNQLLSVDEPELPNKESSMHVHVPSHTSSMVANRSGTHEKSLTQSQQATSKSTVNLADQSASARRRAIKRQVRLLFIYPCVYMAMLLIPFISHCFNYSDYWAQHPPYALALLSTICWTSMGLADCLCFSIREKPWKHIPGSDGTFLGSLVFWRIMWPDYFSGRPSSRGSKSWSSTHADAGFTSMGSDSRENGPRPASQGSARRKLASLRTKKPALRRDFSGRSDREMQGAEDAAARLQMERAERVMSMSAKHATNPVSPSREWFDRPMSGMSNQSGESQNDKESSLPGSGRTLQTLTESDGGSKDDS